MKLDGFANASEILKSGVYALCHKGVVIYVGKSKSMLTRIYTHKNIWAQKRRPGSVVPSWLPVPGIMFDEVHIQPAPLDKLDELERAMIDRYRPRYNVQLKASTPIRREIPLTINGVALTLNKNLERIERRI